jgi:hypothetical protein
MASPADEPVPRAQIEIARRASADGDRITCQCRMRD